MEVTQVLSSWLLACLLAVSSQPTGGSKTLMLLGGWITKDRADIWDKVISLAGGRGVARIGILTSASSRPLFYGRGKVAMFESYGAAEAYWIPIHRDNLTAAMDKEVVANIRRMTGFYLDGGYQQRYIETLLLKDRKPSLAYAAIRDMYESGTLVVGNSAGAMVMPDVYTVVNGSSYGALKLGAMLEGEGSDRSDLIYDPKGGFGFISGHIIDVHFHEQAYQGRLIRLLADTQGKPLGTKYGVGIDEEAGLLVTNVGTDQEKGEVLGRGGVSYIDISKSSVDKASKEFRILNVYCHYATTGDIIDMNAHTVTFSASKKSIKDRETRDYAITSTDIFAKTWAGSQSEFHKVANALFTSRYDSLAYGKTSESNPGYYVVLIEDSTSNAYIEPGQTPLKIAYENMRVGIRPYYQEN